MTAFITNDDIVQAKSDSPLVIGQMKLRELQLLMTHTDAEIDAVATEAKALKETYTKWQEFKDDLALRKARLLGFQAALTQLNLPLAAAQLGTTTLALTTFLGGYVTQEQTKIAQLEALWNAGDLPGYDIFLATA